MSQILSLDTERQTLPVSRGHLREVGDFVVLFQCTLDIAESSLCDSRRSPPYSSGVTAELCSTSLHGK